MSKAADWKASGLDQSIFEGAYKDGIPEDKLITNAGWLKACADIYDLKGDTSLPFLDKAALDSFKAGKTPSHLTQDQLTQLGQWGMEEMSWFNNNTGYAAKTAIDVVKSTLQQSQSYLYMMEAYDHKNMSLYGWGRGGKAMLFDPLTYISVGTVGAGFAVKKSAEAAGKIALKETLKATIRASTGAMAIGAADGVLGAAVSDVSTQNIQIKAEKQEDFDKGRFVTNTALGAVIGGAAPVVVPVAVKESWNASKGVVRKLFGSHAAEPAQEIATQNAEKIVEKIMPADMTAPTAANRNGHGPLTAANNNDAPIEAGILKGTGTDGPVFEQTPVVELKQPRASGESSVTTMSSDPTDGYIRSNGHLYRNNGTTDQTSNQNGAPHSDGNNSNAGSSTGGKDSASTGTDKQQATEVKGETGQNSAGGKIADNTLEELAPKELTFLSAPKESIFNTLLKYHPARMLNVLPFFNYRPHRFFPNIFSEKKYIDPVIRKVDEAISNAGIIDPAKALESSVIDITNRLKSDDITPDHAKTLLAEQFRNFGETHQSKLDTLKENLAPIKEELDIYESKYGKGAKNSLINEKLEGKSYNPLNLFLSAEKKLAKRKQALNDTIDIGPLSQKYSSLQGLDKKQLDDLREFIIDIKKTANNLSGNASQTFTEFNKIIDQAISEGQNSADIANILQVALSDRIGRIGKNPELRMNWSTPAGKKTIATEDARALSRSIYMGTYNPYTRTQKAVDVQNIENRLITALNDFKNRTDDKGNVKNDVYSANAFLSLTTAMYDSGYGHDAARLIRALQIQRGRASVETFPNSLKTLIESEIKTTRDPHKRRFFEDLLPAVSDIKDDNFYLGARDVEKRYYASWGIETMISQLYPGTKTVAGPTMNKYVREPVVNNAKKLWAFLTGGETVPPDPAKEESLRQIKRNWWWKKAEENGSWTNNNFYTRSPAWIKAPVRIATLPLQTGWYATKGIFQNRTVRDIGVALGLTGLVLTGAEEGLETVFPTIEGTQLDLGSRMVGGVLTTTNIAASPITWGIKSQNAIVKYATGIDALSIVDVTQALDLNNSLIPLNVAYLGDRGKVSEEPKAADAQKADPVQAGAVTPPSNSAKATPVVKVLSLTEKFTCLDPAGNKKADVLLKDLSDMAEEFKKSGIQDTKYQETRDELDKTLNEACTKNGFSPSQLGMKGP